MVQALLAQDYAGGHAALVQHTALLRERPLTPDMQPHDAGR
jgi:hypothetical protein